MEPAPLSEAPALIFCEEASTWEEKPNEAGAAPADEAEKKGQNSKALGLRGKKYGDYAGGRKSSKARVSSTITAENLDQRNRIRGQGESLAQKAIS